MNTEKSLQLAGFVIFLIVTVLTYYFMIPLSAETNSTANKSTNTITNTTANTTDATSEINPLTNIYRLVISLTAGGVIGVVTVSLIYSSHQH